MTDAAPMSEAARTYQHFREIFGGNVGVDRHMVYSAAAASGRSERGSGKNSFSSAAETVSTCSW